MKRLKTRLIVEINEFHLCIFAEIVFLRKHKVHKLKITTNSIIVIIIIKNMLSKNNGRSEAIKQKKTRITTMPS